MFDYTNAKNETAAKKQARIDVSNLLFKLLVKEFGKNNVAFVDKDTVAFIFGTVNDNEGSPCDFVATVKPTLKNYQEHNGEIRHTEAYDFIEEVKSYRTGLGMDVSNIYECLNPDLED